MKNTLLILIVAIGSFVLLTSELGKFTGSPGAKSGSPGDNGVTCTQCHGGSATDQEDWLTSNIPATGYVPGETYTITAAGSHAGAARFGFEATAEDSGNAKTGTFIITNDVENRFTNDDAAVTHKSTGTTPNGDSKSWSFDWIAPQAGTGEVGFYAAFNAANGNGSPSGDVIYKTSMFVGEDINTSVGDSFGAKSSVRVFPNPFTNYFTVNIPGENAKVSSLKVFNSIGKQVYSKDNLLDNEDIGITATGLLSGIYYVVVYFDDDTRVTKRIVKK
ncbi:MAG: T9SS type A sorting domain-containing protein [Chlorobi bacterium]|nr:T9SS type A sorting domain-containing protein [Chlorobiota bacterium]